MPNVRLHTAVAMLTTNAGRIGDDFMALVAEAKTEFASLVTLMTKRADPNDTADIDSQSGEIETINARLATIHDQMTSSATALKQAASDAAAAPSPIVDGDTDQPAPQMGQDGGTAAAGTSDSPTAGTAASDGPTGATGPVVTAVAPATASTDPAAAWGTGMNGPTGATGPIGS